MHKFRLTMTGIMGICILLMWGCASNHAPIYADNQVIAVTPGYLDSFDNLAEKYLGDKKKGWAIAQYNQLENPVPGQTVLIPQVLFQPGGLAPDSYQLIPVLNIDTRSDFLEPEKLQAAISMLNKCDLTPIGVSDFLSFLTLSADVPEKAIILTITSTQSTVATAAVPILKKYQIPAIIFITTARVGRPGMLSWEQLRDMARHGMTIGSAGHTGRAIGHPTDSDTFASFVHAVHDEVEKSAMEIAEHIGHRPIVFSYPGGSYGPMTVERLKAAGFRIGFTSEGTGSNPFFVDRYAVSRQSMPQDAVAIDWWQTLAVHRKMDLR